VDVDVVVATATALYVSIDRSFRSFSHQCRASVEPNVIPEDYWCGDTQGTHSHKYSWRPIH